MNIRAATILVGTIACFPLNSFASYCDQSYVEVINGTGKTLNITNVANIGNSTVNYDKTTLSHGDVAHFTVASGKGTGGGARGIITLADSSAPTDTINLEYVIVRHTDLGHLHCHAVDVKMTNNSNAFSYIAQQHIDYGPVTLKYTVYTVNKGEI